MTADNPVEVKQISLPLPDLETLRAEALAQNFAFVERLVSDWDAGLNRFSQDGEVLLGAFAHGRLIGVGGLNQDPYAPSAQAGRIRHLYVLAAWRRRGVGKALLDRLMESAAKRFREVRLRTDRQEAASFYENCGFERSADDTASHRRKL